MNTHIADRPPPPLKPLPPHRRRDAHGCLFDPEFHVEKDGEPVMNQDGTFRKRPGKKIDEVIDDEPPAADENGELL